LSRPRDEYAEVGRATRAAIEQALATAEGRELTRYSRTLLAVLHSTTSWSRTSDSLYLAQLAEIAGIPDVDGKHTAEQLRLLASRGVIAWQPSYRHGFPSTVGLPGSAPIQLPILRSMSL
jgi:hypothetical protein